jgi:hypothetical protein
MVGANGTTAGTAGAVTQPAATDNVKFLRGDGTWAAPPTAAAGATNQIQYNSGGALTGNVNFVYSAENVGIGTTSPGAKLDVNGTIKITGGTPGAGKVLTSDATGLASWTMPLTGTVTSVGITAPASGITVASGSPVTTSGNIILLLANDLSAVESLSTTGLAKRTAADTWTTVTDNSANWDTSYTDRLKWDGGATGLVATTGRTSLGLGSLATLSAVGSTEITNDSIVNADISASATIADTKLATISTAGKVSGSAITSGTIGGTTTISTSGTIATTSTVSAVGLSSTSGLNVSAVDDVTIKADTNAGGVGSIAFSTRNIERMRVVNGGNVGIGTTSPSYTLHVNGSVAGNGSYNSLSDIRFKKDVQDLVGSLAKVLAIRGVSYKWIDEEKNGSGTHYGVIAQEIEKILPDVVVTGSDGIKRVKYDDLIPVIIEALKVEKANKDAEIAQLKSESALLKSALCSKFSDLSICSN